jgi:hypothetical protein
LPEAHIAGSPSFFDVLILFLTYFVLDAMCCCLCFVSKLRRAQLQWPAEATSLLNDRLRPHGDVVRDWFNLESVAKRARCIGALVYYLVVLIALFIVTSSAAYAKYPPNLSRFLAVGMSLSVVFACAIALCFEAKRVRAMAKQNLLCAIISAKGNRVNSIGRGERAIDKGAGNNGGCTELLEFLLRQVDLKSEVAFGPFSRHPLVWTILVLAAGFGWAILFENGMLPGF